MLKNNLDDLDSNGTVGDWCFLRDKTLIAIRYGENYLTGTTVIPISLNSDNPSCWLWNGDEEKPTLSPSIFVHSYPDWTEGWHGFLRNGELISV